jgi:hypothetical protein
VGVSLELSEAIVWREREESLLGLSIVLLHYSRGVLCSVEGLLGWETPGLWINVIVLGEEPSHPIQVPREQILTTNFIHSGKVVHDL